MLYDKNEVFEKGFTGEDRQYVTVIFSKEIPKMEASDGFAKMEVLSFHKTMSKGSIVKAGKEAVENVVGAL